MAIDDLPQRLSALAAELVQSSRARTVLLVGRGGRLLACAGECGDFDPSEAIGVGRFVDLGVFAANLAVEPDEELEARCPHRLDGERWADVSLVGRRVFLVALCDRRTTPGLVRPRARAAKATILGWFTEITGASGGSGALPAEMSDEDVEAMTEGPLTGSPAP